MENELTDVSELFLVHQSVCSDALQQEANEDVNLLTEYPDRLNEVLVVQWTCDVKRAISHASCWQDHPEKSLTEIFNQYCLTLHALVKQKAIECQTKLAIINKAIDDPESMGRFPSPLKQYVERLIQS